MNILKRRRGPVSPVSGTYVLVTTARNESRTIGRTIRCVAGQTRRPAEWVIVSDGSVDGTDDLVRAASSSNPWIQLIPLPPRSTPSFAAVAKNIELGVSRLKSRNYEFLGLIDADVELQSDYFERLIEFFRRDSCLGLAGGAVIDVGHPRNQFPRNRHDVPGAAQFFRRTCFESLGGLVPIPEGGWDSLTCAVARKNGFRTRLITELVVDHLKPRNVSQGGVLRRNWQMGIRDYAIGYDVWFEVAKCLGRLARPPFFFGAIAWWLGFCCATLRRPKRVVPPDLVRYLRRQQKRRLFSALGLAPRHQEDHRP